MISSAGMVAYDKYALVVSRRLVVQRSLYLTTLWMYVKHDMYAQHEEFADHHLQAKNALDHLNGFHLQERYIVVLYHMPAKQDAAAAKADLARREEELAQLKQRHDIKDED